MSNANALTQTEARDRLQSADYPGDDEIRNMHYEAVANIYRDIRACGHRDPLKLLSRAPSSQSDRPEDGLYTDPEVWFEEIAKPVLTSMPDVARPYGSFIEWRFMGELDGGETSHTASISNHRLGFNRVWP